MRIFELIHAEGPTLFFTVPSGTHACSRSRARNGVFDLSSLRVCVSSGEALPPALIHAWRSRFGHELLDVVEIRRARASQGEAN